MLDMRLWRIIGRIAVVVTLIMGIVVSCRAQTGPFAYVTNQSDGTVSVIETSTNTVVTTITLCTGCTPAGLAITPDGKFVYVANQGNGTVNGSVSVIATSTNTVVNTIDLSCDCFAPSAVGVAITPDGLHAYVTDKGQSAVHVIDTTTNTVTTSITASAMIYPFSIAITPDGAYVYATESFPGTPYTSTVNMISTATNAVVASINVGNNPTGVAVSPNGLSVYVTNRASDTVSVFGANNLIPTITTILLPEESGPYSVAFTPDSAFAYVVNQSSNTVSVINTATQTVGTTIPGSCIFTNEIAITPNGTEAYVADAECSTVDVISTASNTETTSVGVGSGPYGVAIGPASSGTPGQSIPVSSVAGSFNFGWPVGCNPDLTPNNCSYTFGITYPAGMFPDGGTASVAPNITSQPQWALRTPPGNLYNGTQIAQVVGQGGGNDGIIFSASCTISGGVACPNSSQVYTTSTTWQSTDNNYCTEGPQLLKADPIGSDNWVGTLIGCTDGQPGTKGTSCCKLSDWANVKGVKGATANFSPTNVNFGNVPVFSVAISVVTIKNTGNASLNITSIKVASVSGGDSNDFFTIGLCPRSLGVGKSCTVFVGFFGDEIAVNPQSATLTITDNTTGSPQLLPMTATVVKRK